MVIITCLYLALVYLLFFKFRILPWSKISQAVCLIVGVVIGARIALLRVRNERLAQRIDLHLALVGSFEQTDGE